jgi:lipopolysaccharide assembly outer membrane protein LptD (OstA)
MIRFGYIAVPLLSFLVTFGTSISLGKKRTLFLDHADRVNRRKTDQGWIYYGYGNVRLRLDSTNVKSDSVVWNLDLNNIFFYGNVEAKDSIQQISARKISYFDRDSIMIAEEDVIMIHSVDSIRTESRIAEFHLADDLVYLDGDPYMFLNYPDVKNLVRISSDEMVFYANEKQGEAIGNVIITHQETKATGGCAEFDRLNDLLTLTDEPIAVRGSSEIKGDLMEIRFSDAGVNRIDVYEDANAVFVEEGDSTTSEFQGESKLSGNDITFYFQDDEVRKISAKGSARSEYYPSPDDTTGSGKNIVSGDSIFIYVRYEQINKIEIKGGAEGVYITEKEQADSTDSDSLESAAESEADTLKPATLTELIKQRADSVQSDSLAAITAVTTPIDTSLALPMDTTITDSLAITGIPEDSIHYQGDFLEYFAKQRILRITGSSNVRQGNVLLDAHQIDYDIPKRIVLAHARVDSLDTIVDIQPLSLKDGSEEIHGSKLVFNVDTKKGLIEDATTQYERAYYRGKDLHKEDEKVFYVQDGLLTSCELDEPHFHFRSKKMKLIHNDRVIARPVTFYIETLPVMTFPYYVFPLKRGRHSGILPIRLGNFEKGNRFIGNLGYYWAASEYWDVQASLDFFENAGIKINSYFRYNKRYSYNGNVSFRYARNRRELALSESRSDDWQISGSHKQTLPYDISFGASGSFISSKGYTDNYEIDPTKRRDRILKSQANFNKKFGRGSVSLAFIHNKNIDTEAQSVTFPQGSISLPSFHPFGSGREVDGKTVKKWYNYLYVGYRNSFRMFADRRKLPDSSLTRKEFGYIDHSISLSASQKIFTYISIGPNVSSAHIVGDLFRPVFHRIQICMAHSR